MIDMPGIIAHPNPKDPAEIAQVRVSRHALPQYRRICTVLPDSTCPFAPLIFSQLPGRGGREDSSQVRSKPKHGHCRSGEMH